MKHAILVASMLAAPLLAPLLLAGTAAAQAPLAAPDSQPAAYTFAVDLDARGQVTGIAPDGAMPEAARKELESRIGEWAFTPAEANGQPATTRTYLRVTTSGSRGPDGMMKVLSATTGPGVASLANPAYPTTELRRGEGGIVVLQLAVDANGRVTGVDFYGDRQRASRSLANAAKVAAQDWRFKPETVNGTPIASTVVLPVCFMATHPTMSTCSWQGPDAKNFNRMDIVAVNPAARVETGVGQFASN
ncbi:energy transducer TonB [Marilutibacter chinensis]|uniref:Energy transducer TonB n=1 Tax=Marilutibacter chinensis TaxID=2912247 RepID=A0ABS9HNX2_9GAMM|nr:energy transducer TonB [Lysobacter chinensis]MCF7220675.1 energy transducer TonB [Lysobacter chinensis]